MKIKLKQSEIIYIIILITAFLAAASVKTVNYISGLKVINSDLKTKYQSLLALKKINKEISRVKENSDSGCLDITQNIVRVQNFNDFKFFIIEKFRKNFSAFDKYQIAFTQENAPGDLLKTVHFEINFTASGKELIDFINFLNRRTEIFRLSKFIIKNNLKENLFDIQASLTEYYNDET
ncbi:MAG TPA: hypothetical protein PKY81_03545 [bacterium]|nr:hypothetical protein [bacterium]HPN30010.1 hypothetical protein [bacterium]